MFVNCYTLYSLFPASWPSGGQVFVDVASPLKDLISRHVLLIVIWPMTIVCFIFTLYISCNLQSPIACVYLADRVSQHKSVKFCFTFKTLIKVCGRAPMICRRSCHICEDFLRQWKLLLLSVFCANHFSDNYSIYLSTRKIVTLVHQIT